MTSHPKCNLITNLTAGSDLSSSQFKAVVLSGDGAVDVADAGAQAIGFLMDAPSLAQSCEIATIGGGAKAIAGGIIDEGNPLAVDANGDLVVAQTGDAVVAIAIDSAVDNDVFPVLVMPAAQSVETVQELVASGAVNPRVQSVELNDASVVVAATIADASNHQGLFVVKDTSPSGTAAHTLTLTAGTFDGTNNVATLNAPNEALVVFFDSAGNGTIVENVGSVGLS